MPASGGIWCAALLVLAVVLAFCGLAVVRYSLVAGSAPRFYVLDRWTGQVTVCALIGGGGTRCARVWPPVSVDDLLGP